ncbi:uncharacterized protein SEPMUDRAFT_133067 [Sphaerulina musiva SO2202]|uniref:Uncharacterized protein n=1 Tax=Sphaerulina musiva (strain SO2202) TaxID=692275 RepID=M3C0N7_SPHMS|nr:uncharacterized protein SEPMUDRAFT_133067 [Sphaerulina musiva SO2202]EMF13876.1 hypothetical protein SEPMUDRAFT_133067 [Sphaerulina musiva SO2202]
MPLSDPNEGGIWIMCLLAKTPESYQPGHRHEQLLFRYDRGRAPSHTTVPAAASIYCTASRVKKLVELPRHAQWATNVPSFQTQEVFCIIEALCTDISRGMKSPRSPAESGEGIDAIVLAKVSAHESA